MHNFNKNKSNLDYLLERGKLFTFILHDKRYKSDPATSLDFFTEAMKPEDLLSVLLQAFPLKVDSNSLFR